MEKLIKENILYIIIALAAFIGGIVAIVYFGSTVFQNLGEIRAQKESLESLQGELKTKQTAMAGNRAKKKESKSGKVIYEVLGQQFSAEASFGIMFENILSNITNSGLRIHAIDYNYKLTDDKILQTNLQGYNACELSFTAIGSYTQLQNFFKNIAKENYLTSISEVYIEPYDKDKSILITRFKIRLYTKTI